MSISISSWYYLSSFWYQPHHGWSTVGTCTTIIITSPPPPLHPYLTNNERDHFPFIWRVVKLPWCHFILTNFDQKNTNGWIFTMHWVENVHYLSDDFWMMNRLIRWRIYLTNWLTGNDNWLLFHFCINITWHDMIWHDMIWYDMITSLPVDCFTHMATRIEQQRTHHHVFQCTRGDI